MSWTEIPDVFGRQWPGVPLVERCTECGPPDNCRNCDHNPLKAEDVIQLEGTLEYTEETRTAVALIINSIKAGALANDKIYCDQECDCAVCGNLKSAESLIYGNK